MSVLKKIFEARKIIRDYDVKKLGFNKHSNYAYYTPEQISELVTLACDNILLINTYELKRSEYGLIAQLTVTDLDTEEFKVFDMATEIPAITATNITQQLGGAVTYSERYLLMATYDIKDNSLDFDADKKQKNQNSNKTQETNFKARDITNFEARDITKSEVDNKWNGKLYAGNALYIDNKKIVVSADQIKRLKAHAKYKPDEKK